MEEISDYNDATSVRNATRFGDWWNLIINTQSTVGFITNLSN